MTLGLFMYYKFIKLLLDYHGDFNLDQKGLDLVLASKEDISFLTKLWLLHQKQSQNLDMKKFWKHVSADDTSICIKNLFLVS